MAEYNDYVDDGIGNEIDDAAANQQARDAQGRFIPERFRGKDISDVVQSYEELEKLNSRQAQDLGDMRRTVDQLLELQTQSSPVEETTAVPMTADEFYENPDDTIRRVAREETSNEVKDLKDELTQLRLERKFEELEGKFPEWHVKSNSPEFAEWTKNSPYRTRIAQDAAQGNFDAAEEILGMYYDSEVTAEATEEVVVADNEQLRNAMLESGGPAPVQLVDEYSRYDLLEKRMAAKRGDLKAERWLSAHADSIAIAYAEGRIVD